MFAKLFRRKDTPKKQIVVARLAARLQPIGRGEFFEDPLDELLDAAGLGSVVGGGTELADDPVGIRACDVEISAADTSPDTVKKIIAMLEGLGAPKGSEIRIEGRAPVPFGATEGLAIFLNGTDLPREVYKQSDVNVTIHGLSDAMAGTGEFRGYWEGSKETALYFYGTHFDEMKKAAQAYADRDALCAQCRIEQIA